MAPGLAPLIVQSVDKGWDMFAWFFLSYKVMQKSETSEVPNVVTYTQ